MMKEIKHDSSHLVKRFKKAGFGVELDINAIGMCWDGKVPS